MIYDITGNALLSPAAQMLSPTALGAYASVAEQILGLGPPFPVYTVSGDVVIAKDAVSIQVNRILELRQSELLKSWTDGARSETYIDARGDPFDADALAWRLLQTLVPAPALPSSSSDTVDGYEPLRSLRGGYHRSTIMPFIEETF